MDKQEALEEMVAPPTGPTRRVVLAGAGAAAVVVLGGCQTYDQGGGPPPDDGGDVGAGGDAGDVGDPEPSGSASPGATGGAAKPKLADTGDIPVGGGKVFEGSRVVVTQPRAGTFKAFTAVCTHQGCLVTEVSDSKIVCPCHGSAFKVADGSVANGPASRSLREIKIKVDGTAIRRA